MTKSRESWISGIFRRYNDTLKELLEDYNFPSVGATDYSKLVVQSTKGNTQEDKIINYADRRTVLYAEKFIVEETLQYFHLEGHGRDRFVRFFFIDGNGWIATQRECCICERTLAYWRRDVLEKAEILGQDIGYFKG